MKIEFISIVKGMTENCPILPAAKALPQWLHNAKDHYKNHSDKKSTHLARCPGIMDFLTTGFVVTTWHDTFITTSETYPDSFKSEVPEGIPFPGGSDMIINAHGFEGIREFIPRSQRQSKILMKMNTPWHVKAPEGIKLLMLPISYPDEDILEGTSGILDPRLNPQINVHIWWNLIQGKHELPANTPIAHIIPLTDQPVELVMRDAEGDEFDYYSKTDFARKL
jgi:hypothetical protein